MNSTFRSWTENQNSCRLYYYADLREHIMNHTITEVYKEEKLSSRLLPYDPVIHLSINQKHSFFPCEN